MADDSSSDDAPKVPFTLALSSLAAEMRRCAGGPGHAARPPAAVDCHFVTDTALVVYYISRSLYIRVPYMLYTSAGTHTKTRSRRLVTASHKIRQPHARESGQALRHPLPGGRPLDASVPLGQVGLAH